MKAPMSSLVVIQLCNHYAALQISAYDIVAECLELSRVDQRDAVCAACLVY